MSFLVHDLRCSDGHVETSVVYRRSDGPTPCFVEGCAKPRTVTYLPREAGGGSALVEGETWVPFKHDGVVYHTRGEWKAHKERFARANGVSVDQVVEVDNSDRVVRGEEARHRAYLSRKARGIDDTQLRDWQGQQSRSTRIQVGYRR